MLPEINNEPIKLQVKPTNGLRHVESNILDGTEQNEKSLGKSDMNAPNDPCESDRFGWALRDPETPVSIRTKLKRFSLSAFTNYLKFEVSRVVTFAGLFVKLYLM